GLSSFSYRLR
ncbi:hypothetical protein D018_3330B, partial [Vibrio parahaemolyticus VP2007-007]